MDTDSGRRTVDSGQQAADTDNAWPEFRVWNPESGSRGRLTTPNLTPTTLCPATLHQLYNNSTTMQFALCCKLELRCPAKKGGTSDAHLINAHTPSGQGSGDPGIRGSGHWAPWMPPDALCPPCGWPPNTYINCRPNTTLPINSSSSSTSQTLVLR